MKKISTLLIFTLVVMMMQAQPVSVDEAATIAQRFFNLEQQGKQPQRMQRAALPTGEATSEAEPYYIFNAPDGKGFVIISADKRARCLLGYSHNGTFQADNVPPQLTDLLNRYAEQIAAIPANAAMDASWSTSQAADDTKPILLETVNWGQGSPYNMLCPTVDGEYCPTGCVATAMAIVMKYHNWPERYDWAAMPATDVTTENANEIATLMKDAGEAVEMQYTLEESGANMNWVGHKLQQTFSYSPECQFITAQNFNAATWQNMIHENLQAGNPIIYNGSGTGGNHAFIIDGYQEGNYHINWGWDGSYNGYFALDALAPYEGCYFSNNAGMVINITPDRSGKRYSPCFTDYGYFWALCGKAPGANMSVVDVVKGEPFDFISNTLSLPKGFVWDYGIAWIGADGEIKSIIKSKSMTTWSDIDGDYVFTGITPEFYNCVLPIEPEEGDVIQLVAKANGEEEWLPVLGTIESPSYCPTKGNTPRTAKVEIQRDLLPEDIRFEYYGNSENQYIDITESCTLELLIGERFFFSVSHYDYKGLNGNIIVEIWGDLVYRDYTLESDTLRCAHSLRAYSDYIIKCSFMEFIEGKEVTIETPGELHTLLSKDESMRLKDLTVKGVINADDIWYIRDYCSALHLLDLENCTIAESNCVDTTYNWGSATSHPADYLPLYAFHKRRIHKIKLPKNLKGLGSGSLSQNNLTDIDIPASVENIDLNVFFDNPNLKTVILRNPIPVPISDCIFTDTPCPENGILYVPVGSKEAYLQANVWNRFGQIVEDDNPNAEVTGFTIDNLRYKIQGLEALVIGYEGTPVDVVIPETVVWNDREYTVTRIEREAFYDCESLKSVTMSDNIIEIGYWAFAYSTLEQIEFSQSLTTILGYCFAGTNIQAIDFPPNIKIIENGAFQRSALSKVYIPKTIESISSSSFCELKQLERFEVDPEHEFYTVVDGILYTKDMTTLLTAPAGMSGVVEVPSTVETISESAFYGNQEITEVIMGDNVKEIKYLSFMNCESLQHLTIPNKVTLLDYCIGGKNLQSVTLGRDVSSLHGTISHSYNLQKVYLLNTANINATELLSDAGPRPKNLYFYTPYLYSNIRAEGHGDVYVPGKSPVVNDGGREMWDYRLHKELNALSVIPLIEGIVIDEVAINGTVVEPQGTLYQHEPCEELEVVVTYTLNNRQQMSTHYDSVFNDALPSEDTGVSSTLADNTTGDVVVYNLQGVAVYRGDNKYLPQLKQGIYIVKYDNRTEKLVVR